MELTIKDMVEGIGLPALRNLRTRLGISQALTHKNELVEAVADHIDKNVRFVVRQLTPMEQKLVAEVAHNNGSYNLPAFRAKHQGWSPLVPSHASSRDSSLVWLFFKFYDGQCVMPPELVARLKGLLSKPAQPQISVQEEVPAEIPDKEFGSRPVRIHNGSEASLIELKKVLGLVSAGKLRVAPKSKRPTAGTEKKIESILISEDFDLELPKEQAGSYKYAEPGGRVRSHSWAVLLQQCGWAKARGESLSLTEAGTRMMTLGRMEDLADGVERLIDDGDFDELHRINHIRGQTGRAKRYMTRPSTRRFAIFQSMSGWPVEKWISVNEAYRLVRASGQDLETCRQPLYLYFGSFEYGHLSDGSGVDRQYLRAFLFESLGTLGLVDVAYVFPHFLWPDFGGAWGPDD
ncbi:MAG: hypothetical protein FJY85_18510, partial [Deltaproteobacteria bacterium]|nr:hypothetical protein [Deltaproteobacteria bacterium]